MKPDGPPIEQVLPGAGAVVEWLGRWAFHDFEVLEVPPAAATDGTIRIRGWVTDRHALDARGCFKRSRFCVVSVQLDEIRHASVSDDGLPAIIFDLEIVRTSEGSWRMAWDASYGAAGVYEAKRLVVSVAPDAEPMDDRTA